MKTIALEKQHDYYVNHEAELLTKYNGMHLIISGDLQVVAFAKPQEAYAYGERYFCLGNFLLQPCTPGILQRVNTVNCAF